MVDERLREKVLLVDGVLRKRCRRAGVKNYRRSST
jgi:hypothetical protein